MKCRELALNLIKKVRGECQTLEDSYKGMLKVNDIYRVTTVFSYRASLSQLIFQSILLQFWICFSL